MKRKFKWPERRPDKTQTTISLSESIFLKVKELAAADGRSFSNYLEQVLKKQP